MDEGEEMNPWYSDSIKKRWTFNKWNWLWLWIFPTYVAFGEGEYDPFAIFYKVVGTRIYIVGEERRKP